MSMSNEQIESSTFWLHPYHHHLSHLNTSSYPTLAPAKRRPTCMSGISNAQNNNNTVDPWSFSGGNTKTHGARYRQPARAPKHIPDAWDDDDDDAGEEEDNTVDSAAIWNNANAKPPMPEVILTTSNSAAPPPEALQQPMRILKRPSASSSSSTSSPSSISSLTPSGVGVGAGQGTTTLQDREAAYQAARARIFGAEGKSKDADGNNTTERIDTREAQERLKNVTLDSPSSTLGSSGSSSNFNHGQTTSATTSSVIRNPFGPPSGASSSTVNGTIGAASDGTRVDQKGFVKRRGGSTGVDGRTHAAGSADGPRFESLNAKS